MLRLIKTGNFFSRGFQFVWDIVGLSSVVIYFSGVAELSGVYNMTLTPCFDFHIQELI
jgi:hypothetical protein